MTVKQLCLCLIVVFLQWPAAQSHSYAITDNSTIIYHGYHPFRNWSGVSHAASGSVAVSAGNPTSSSCSVQVSLESFDSGSSSRDSNMLTYTEYYLYPDVVFESEKISVSGHTVTVQGQLSFHGVTRTVTVSAEVDTTEQFSASGMFSISLSDYAVERPSLFLLPISDKIDIEFDLKGVLNENE